MPNKPENICNNPLCDIRIGKSKSKKMCKKCAYAKRLGYQQCFTRFRHKYVRKPKTI